MSSEPDGLPPNPLAGYDDWPGVVRSAGPFTGPDETSTALGRLLGAVRLRASVVTEAEIVIVDGVEVQGLWWSVGYGPATRAWLLRPEGETGMLPGVLAMHCHGGVRSVGAESMLDLGPGSRPRAAALRQNWYGGRAPANAAARRGFAVLVHDAFSWGSRAFDLSRPGPKLVSEQAAHEALWREQGRDPDADERFDLISGLHEDTLAKAAGVLGQTFAGAVLSDDLVALDVLANRSDVDAERLGAFGFSGGGGRTLLLAAVDHRVRVAGMACMMATFGSLVPHYLDHSWLLHAPGLWSFADWPDLTEITRARFLIQYRRDDPLFPASGMAAAHQRLKDRHAGTDRYRGTFWPGGHAFGPEMQRELEGFFFAAF